jgi:peptidoglycan/LPS O-acetylase OafA/YrhL
VLIYREGWSKKGDLAAAAVALFYVSNWVQAWRLLPLNQLSHTWSLGIEEQFYLLWPVVLLLLCRLRLRPTRLMAAITVAAVASSVWRFVLMYAGASSLRLYNGSDTRADALLFGAAGAVLFGEGLLGHPRRPRPVMAAAGTAALAIIIGYFFVGDADVPHSTSFSALSSHTAIGILGTIVILGLTCSGGANDWMHSILGWRPLRYVGQISYGLYLWHVMILAMLDASGFAGENWIRALIVAAATLGVSVLSYNHVEAPCLRLKHAFAARTGPVPG